MVGKCEVRKNGEEEQECAGGVGIRVIYTYKCHELGISCESRCS